MVKLNLEYIWEELELTDQVARVGYISALENFLAYKTELFIESISYIIFFWKSNLCPCNVI